MTALLFNADGTVDLMPNPEDPDKDFLDWTKRDRLTARLDLHSDGKPVGQVLAFVGYDDMPMNEKAQRAFLLLTGQHIYLSGPVMIYDLDPNTATEILGSL